jgi:hypothetical protein
MNEQPWRVQAAPKRQGAGELWEFVEAAVGGADWSCTRVI